MMGCRPADLRPTFHGVRLQVLNCGSAAAQQYILRTLHHWAQVGAGLGCARLVLA